MMMISSMSFPVSVSVERRGAGRRSFRTSRCINSRKGARVKHVAARRKVASAPFALRMARVAALVLPPRVHDRGFRALRLDAQRRDQRILGVHDLVTGLAVELVTDGKFHRHHPPARCGEMAPASRLI